MGTKFRTLLAPIGVSTGDGRRFAADAITTADGNLPFEWVRQREGGHDGAVTVGAVQQTNIGTVKDAVANGWIGADQVASLDPDQQGIWASGEMLDDADRESMPRLAEDVAEAMHLIGAGTLGPSVDLDSFEGVPVMEGSDEPVSWEQIEDYYDQNGEEPKLELLITQGRVRAATLVSIPAFAETSRPLELLPADEDTDSDAEALLASVTGSTSLPVADPSHTWDGSGAAGRVFDHFTSDGKVDTGSVGKAFLYRDPDADASTKGAYKLGFADIVDGKLTVIPKALAAIAGGRGVGAAKGIPATEVSQIERKTCTLYAKVRAQYSEWPECPFNSKGKTSALIATIGEHRPPAAAFDMPVLAGPTPITFDWENGRVFGHIATWKTCHVGYADVCVTAPHDQSGGYSWFNRFPVETDDADTVWAGRLTVGGQHAPLTLAASSAMSAYDGKTVAAHVRAYEDEHGIVVAGVLEIPADSPERAALDRRKVSGDWRETPAGLSLVEVLALSPGPRRHSEPGFPIPGTFSVAGRQTALTASLGPDPDAGMSSAVDVRGAVQAALAVERARQDLAATLAQETERERAALAAALGMEG